VSWAQVYNIPSPGAFRPTVIDKGWPIESIGSRLCDHAFPHFNQTLSNPDGMQVHVTELKELRRRVEALVKSFLYDRDKGGFKLRGTVSGGSR